MQAEGVYQIIYPKECVLICSPARVRSLGRQLRMYADSLESIRPPAEPITKETIRLNKWINDEQSSYRHLANVSCVPVLGTTVMVIHRNWAVGRMKRQQNLRNDVPYYYPQEIDSEASEEDLEPLIKTDQIAQELLSSQSEKQSSPEFEHTIKPGLILVYPDDLQTEVMDLSNEIHIKKVTPLTVNSKLLRQGNLPDHKFLALVFHRAKIKEQDAHLQELMAETRKYCSNVVLIVLDARKEGRSTVYDTIENTVYQRCPQESVDDPLLGPIKTELIQKIQQTYNHYVRN